MLSLGRHVGQTIVFPTLGITIMVTSVRKSGGQTIVRLGIDAPVEIPVHREEIWKAIQGEQSHANTSKRMD